MTIREDKAESLDMENRDYDGTVQLYVTQDHVKESRDYLVVMQVVRKVVQHYH